MDNTVLVSAATGPMLEAARSWFLRRNGQGEVLVVASTPGAADDFVRDCALGGDGLIGAHRLTLFQLVMEAATRGLAERNRTVITRLGIQALLTRAVFDLLKTENLLYFQPVADTRGFISSLARTIEEIRMESISPARLAGIGPAGPDLARLLAAYEKSLDESLLADRAGLFQIATEEFRKGRIRFAGLPVVLLALPPRTHWEKEFLRVLAGTASACLATNLVGDSEGTKSLEEVLGSPAISLEAHDPDPLGGEWESDSEKGDRNNAPGGQPTKLERLRRQLFSRGPELPAPIDEVFPSLDFFSAPGEGRECVEIARRIRFAADRGVRFDQVAIALRSPELYYPLLQDALRRTGIPAWFSRGTTRPDPAGRAFLALLECAVEGLSASGFAEYLSLGQVPFPEKDGRPPERQVEWVEPKDGQLSFKTVVVAETASEAEVEEDEQTPVQGGNLRVPAQWERLLVDAAVIGGRDRWARRIQGLEKEFQMQLLRGMEENDEATRRHLQRRLENLLHLKNFALPVMDFLDGMRSPRDWADWLDCLRGLAAMALKRPGGVLALLAELSPMGEVGPIGLEEVRGVLSERLTFLRTDPPRDRHGAVLVATLDELAGRCFDTVFLPGLAEGIFPRKPNEDPLLLDTARRELGLKPTLQQRRTLERLLLRTGIAAAKRQLVVSYPRVDIAQNRARVPSFYALDVFRAAEGALPDVSELELKASASCPVRLGWPAPSDHTLAIDDAEFDLAWLEPFLHQTPSRTTGRARFLLEVNSRLARSLRTRARRWRSRFSEADGLVNPDPATLELLQSERLRSRSYSPTSLQQFSVCPYKFLLYSILRLRPREEPVAIEQLDPLTRGGLFHEVQFRFFRGLRSRTTRSVNKTNLEEATALLDSILEEVARDYGEELAPAIPRIWDAEIEALRSDLKGWLKEVANLDREWVPDHFEYAFGMSAGEDRDSESTSEEATIFGGMKIRGSIDLVERNVPLGHLRVTDHKTGRAPDQAGMVVRGGAVLQPLLYGLAAEQLLGEHVEAGQLFYCTQKGNYQRISVAINPGTCEKLRVVLDIIDRSIEKAFLAAAPAEDACSYCDYRLVCGPYEEYRVGRKSSAQLVDLKMLRELP